MKNNTRNAAYTKLYNKKKILSIIQRQAVSRAEIARQIGLTRAAVSIIVDEFISEGIVIVGGTKEAAKGRRPLLLDINPQSYYSIGLNISRDNCCCGIVNIKGEVIARLLSHCDDLIVGAIDDDFSGLSKEMYYSNNILHFYEYEFDSLIKYLQDFDIGID